MIKYLFKYVDFTLTGNSCYHLIFCLFIKEYFYNDFILINVTWTQVFLATTSHDHCWIKFTKNRYRDVKVRFSKKWLTVSRLNRLETFFRKPSCDFFFLLVVILLLCYCRSTESVVLLIQLILPLRSHRGTSYFFYSSHKTHETTQHTR